jgi:signal peptidase I
MAKPSRATGAARPPAAPLAATDARAAAAGGRSSLRETVEAILVAGLFLLFVNTWVFRTFFIPSGSMEETLLIGDHLVVNRFVYGPQPTALERRLLPGRAVQRGDIVVFKSPQDPRLDLVKRCLGLAGDVVEMRDKQLYLNGRALEEPWVRHGDPLTGGRDSWHPDRVRRDQMPPLRVPPGHLLCFGDNRDFSLDSRFWGTLPAHLVKGRAEWIYWSYGGDPPPADFQGLRATVQRLGRTALGFFTRTRWERTFSLPR